MGLHAPHRLSAGEPGVLDTVDAAEGRPVAEFDTDGERTAVQKFLYPDREELPDDFSMPIWVRSSAMHAWQYLVGSLLWYILSGALCMLPALICLTKTCI